MACQCQCRCNRCVCCCRGATGPQGIQGPVGPTGPAAAPAYGGLFSDPAAPAFMTLVADTADTLTNLSEERPGEDVLYGPDSITIEQTGTYLVGYAVSYGFDAPAEMQFFLSVNDLPIGSTLVENDNDPALGIQSVSRSALLALDAGDVLQLAVRPVGASGELFLPGGGTELNVVQIG